MTPDVSIILVTYNRAKFLPRTLDGILNQTYHNFELWICDDRSPDNTAEVCQPYVEKDSRVHYVRNEKNLRMPGNLNAGIRRSNCDLVAVLHDGDIYQHTIIEKWRQALLNNPKAGFVFNVYRHLEPDGIHGNLTDVYPTSMTGRYFLEELVFADPEMECPVWGTVMARRKVLDEMGLFNEEYGFWSDMDMYFRIAERYDIAFVPEPLIDLPSRQVMPHLFSSGALLAHSMIFKMYWAARCRHYRGKPLELTSALAEQIWDSLYCKTRRVFRRLVK
jgi:glycosyltransferase involved in cell wall biosynthesis